MESPGILRGSLLLGAWVNIVLFTVEAVLALTFFSRPGGGRPIYYYLVVGLLVNDFACTISGCAGGWMALIDQDGWQPVLTWPVPVIVLSTSLSAVAEQTFLIYRYYSLSKNVPISILLGILVMAHAGFYWFAGIYIATHSSFILGQNLGSIAAMVATTVCATADVLIPAALVWQLRQMKTSFQSTNGLIRRLSVNTLSSGCGMSIFGVTMPILLQFRTSVIIAFAMAFGRLYSLTILVNLVVMKSRRRSTNGGSDVGIHTDGDLENSLALSDAMHVHRSAVIRVKDNTARIGTKGPLILESSPDTMSSSTSKRDFH